MSTQNYTDTQNQPNVQFKTPPVLPDNRQPNGSYIHNQHLSTPPANQRAKNPTLGDGREFTNNTQNFGAYMNKFQLPQINTIYSSNPSNVISYYNVPHQQEPIFNDSRSIQSKIYTPNNPSFYHQSRPMSTESVFAIYQKKKQEYIDRIRNLDDYVEMNFPDEGKYIGQVISKQIKRGDEKMECIKHGQGIFMYPNGDVYFGSWRDDFFDGEGVYIFASGQIYDGVLEQSRKQGRGIYYYQNATAFYSGSWQNDLKDGVGVLNSPEEYYQGQWKEGVKHGNGYQKNKLNHFVYIGEYFEGIKQGKGRMVYSDGSVYTGQYKNHLPHGVGDFQYPNKDKYIGQFYEGKKHGKGNYFFSEGTIFSGCWDNDQKVEGELTLFNGDIFNGYFKNNERYQGKYRYRNGDIYEGTWKDDVKDGYGKLYLQNGEKYQGQFIEGQKHGEGIYRWKNGDRYEGQFAYDKREGLGEYFWSDGGIYKGEWKADRMNGFGRLIKDGVDVIGEFFADHFERPIDEAELGSLRSFVLN